MLLICSLLVLPLTTFAGNLEILHEFDSNNPPGNIAASADGRIFMSVHQFFGTEHKVVEVLSDSSTVPYPNPEFSASLNPVFGIIVDEHNILWMLETAGGKDKAGRLIGWDTEKNQLYKIIYIALPNIPENSFINDIAIDRKHEAVYITDTATPSNSALLVVDLNTGEVRRVLEGSSVTAPENIPMIIDDREIMLGGNSARIGANPITIDHNNEWVYFAAMSGESLYRVRTTDLLNQSLTDKQLEAKVERYSDKPISDGITIDDAGNVYITDITNNAVGVVNTQREYKILHTNDDLLSWPDGFANTDSSGMLVCSNQLHRSPVLNNGENASTGKYYILKFEALANASVGR